MLCTCMHTQTPLTHTHAHTPLTSLICLHVHPHDLPSILSDSLRCLPRPFFPPLPFPFIPSPVPPFLLFPPCLCLLTLSTFISLVVSYIPLSFFSLHPSSLPISSAPPLRSPSAALVRGRLAQTGTKGKETSSGDASLSRTLIRQQENI